MSKDVKLQLKTDWQEWMRVCDWKIPDNYPKPSAVSSHRWAWEFLRRNDEFKKDFENLVSIKNDGQSYEPGRRPRDLARYAIQKKWHINNFAPGILGDIGGKIKAPCYFDSGVANYVHSRKIPLLCSSCHRLNPA